MSRTRYFFGEWAGLTGFGERNRMPFIFVYHLRAMLNLEGPRSKIGSLQGVRGSTTPTLPRDFQSPRTLWGNPNAALSYVEAAKGFMNVPPF